MDTSTAPAAGWFPDPEDASAERWWSGHGWTEHTRAPLGAELPAAFAPHVATLVAERPAEPEAPAAPFVFNMTPSDAAGPATSAPAAAVPSVPAAALPGFTMPSTPAATTSAAPMFAAPLPDSMPAPVVPDAAPMLPEFTAPAMPEFTAPAPAPALPEFTAPAPAAPLADAGFVLPTATILAPQPESETPRVGRHADVVAAPEPVKAPAPVAPRPVGYTASADPDIANRYRSVIHAADTAPAAEPEAGPALASTWPASATAVSFSAPPAYTSNVAPVAGNRPARAARTLGLIALASTVVSVGMRFVDLPGLVSLVPSALVLLAFLSGLVAIVLGIVGLVVARRARTGFGSALAGLLLGVLISVLLPVGVILLAFSFVASLGMLPS